MCGVEDVKEIGFNAKAPLLHRDIVDGGPKLTATIDSLKQQIRDHPSSGVEGESHLPEILYRYGSAPLAHSQILDLTRENRDRREYPEVSYAVIGAIVTGLVGITMEASPFTASGHGDFIDHRVRTLAGLGDMAWAEVRNLPVHRNQITVRQNGLGTTSLTNQSGPSLLWRGCFRGSKGILIIGGQPRPARVGQNLSGQPITWADVSVAPGTTIRAELPL